MCPRFDHKVPVRQHFYDTRCNPGSKIIITRIITRPVKLTVKTGVKFGNLRLITNEIIKIIKGKCIDVSLDRVLLVSSNFLRACNLTRLPNNDVNEIIALPVRRRRLTNCEQTHRVKRTIERIQRIGR